MKKTFTTMFGALACIASVCAQTTVPADGAWYRMLNQQGGGDREATYLGYYPETQWYVFNKDAAGARAMGTNPFIVGCTLCDAETEGGSEAIIDAQMWKFVAGEGDNEGKYCIVNRAFPDGAISNAIVNNDGVPITGTDQAANPSRWQYVANRTEAPYDVCWFTLGENLGDNVFQPTFTNPLNADAKYIALAASGQKYQIIRVTTPGEASTKWQLIPEVAEPEPDPVVFDTSKTYYISAYNNTHVGDYKYLGYYPESAETPWEHYDAESGEIVESCSPLLITGMQALVGDFTKSEVNQQLWKLVEGEGDNAGKYAFVNVAFPAGAISNVPVNNAGEPVAADVANNTSRWTYLADRTASAADVCWFSLEELAAYNETGYEAFITFTPLLDNWRYMQVAGPGQNRQVMRYADAQWAEKWAFIPGEADLTSISEIVAEPAATSAAYDLQGRRVAAGTKGLLIVKGHKILVR